MESYKSAILKGAAEGAKGAIACAMIGATAHFYFLVMTRVEAYEQFMGACVKSHGPLAVATCQAQIKTGCELVALSPMGEVTRGGK